MTRDFLLNYKDILAEMLTESKVNLHTAQQNFSSKKSELEENLQKAESIKVEMGDELKKFGDVAKLLRSMNRRHPDSLADFDDSIAPILQYRNSFNYFEAIEENIDKLDDEVAKLQQESIEASSVYNTLFSLNRSIDIYEMILSADSDDSSQSE